MNRKAKHLVLDAGNTVLKVARFEGKELLRVERIPYAAASVALDDEVEWEPEAVIFSSVAQMRVHDLKHLFNVPVLDFKPGIPMPIEVSYTTPESLGADRLANACGAALNHGAVDQLVIDIGTCITMDLLEGGRHFRGGSISPGLRLRGQAMNAHTARLPFVETDPEVSLTGASTITSLQSGIFYGVLDEMEGRIARYQQVFPKLVVVITGGDSVYFEKAFKSAIFANLNLTLFGLHEILCHNLDAR